MENEFKINLYEIMQDANPSGRISKDGSPAGDTICNLILDNWDKYEKISVYFEGIYKMTRPFCDEAFGKILDVHSLEGFNEKLHFPDANDNIVKQLNDGLKLRLKIIKARKEREDMQAGG
ncbi:MAG: STAS-like domain-containing protein [Nitrospinae bacterium]|nr:STAS-like domain-containing protein [Nitrospinota bacterium]